jgi:hypothetical protein
VNFQVAGSTAGASCASAIGGPDATCNFSIGIISQPLFTLESNPGDNFTFDFLRFTAGSADPIPDNIFVTVTMAFTSPLLLLPFEATGGNGASSGVITAFGRFINANLIWDETPSQTIPGVGIVSLALSNRNIGPFILNPLQAPTNFVVEATVSLQPIPLPAGILLLGSALLGLFGLSRRRKLASA